MTFSRPALPTGATKRFITMGGISVPLTRIFLALAVLLVAACPMNSNAAPDAGQVPSPMTTPSQSSLVPSPPAAPLTPSEAMMEVTIAISGRAAGGIEKSGTGFILAKMNGQAGHYVLVTAGHVLGDIITDTAMMFFHKKVGAEWEVLPAQIPIRAKGVPLWSKHPDADCAAMPIMVPNESTARTILVPVDDVLATDAIISQLALSAGDTLFTLGFPLGVGSQGKVPMFPLMRSGAIASYPIVPLSRRKGFLFDFNVFHGNSGGPVFYYNPSGSRQVGQNVNLGGRTFAVLGLISQKIDADEGALVAGKIVNTSRDLGVAIVVNSTVIAETINMVNFR